jgi:Fimbrial assembly protein (PilN)
LQRYIERYHSYLDAPLRHVYLSGNAEAVDRAKSKFTALSEFQVHILQPGDLDMPWRHAAEIPGTDLAAALGTAMALSGEASEQQGPNLIESALAQQREPMRPILIRSAIPFAAVLLAAATLLGMQIKQAYEVATVRTELERLTPVTVRATELRLKLIGSDAKLVQLKALEEKLPQPDWQRFLSHISQSMPDDVWLDRLSFHDGHSAALAGASYTDGGVYDFVGYLKEVPEIAEIALEGTGVGQSSTGPTTSFNLQLTLANLAGPSGNEAPND